MFERSVRWRKVNSSPVCFGARNHQFGRFYMPSAGRLAAVKLVHLYGYVSCKTPVGVDNWTYWGCGYSQVQHKVNVVITTSTNRILFPPNQLLSSTHGGEGKWHHIIGYNIMVPRAYLVSFLSSSLDLLPSAVTCVVWRRLDGLGRRRQWWKSVLWCFCSLRLSFLPKGRF